MVTNDVVGSDDNAMADNEYHLPIFMRYESHIICPLDDLSMPLPSTILLLKIQCVFDSSVILSYASINPSCISYWTRRTRNTKICCETAGIRSIHYRSTLSPIGTTNYSHTNSPLRPLYILLAAVQPQGRRISAFWRLANICFSVCLTCNCPSSFNKRLSFDQSRSRIRFCQLFAGKESTKQKAISRFLHPLTTPLSGILASSNRLLLLLGLKLVETLLTLGPKRLDLSPPA